MLRTDIVLFTSRFPFGLGETFLEEEVRYLADFFSEVTLVPANLGGSLRPLPARVRVDSSYAVARAGIRPLRSGTWPLLSDLLPPLSRGLASIPRLDATKKAARRVLRYLLAAARLESWFESFVAGGPTATSLDRTVFYSYWFEVAPVGLTAVRRRWPGVRFVSRAHRWDLYEELFEPAFLPFRTAVLDAIDRVFPVSEHGARYLREKYPRYAQKIELSRLGVSPAAAPSRPSSDGVLRIASCSSLTEPKRVHLIVDALEAAARRLPESAIEWWHAGDGPLRSNLERSATERLPRTVTWRFLGEVPNHRVRALYQERPIDLFLNVSASEGVPVSIMEAMSASVPIIATAVGGTPEIVGAENGSLLPENPSPTEIAEAVATFVHERASIRLKRSRSREIWSDRCDASRNYPEFCRRIAAL